MFRHTRPRRRAITLFQLLLLLALLLLGFGLFLPALAKVRQSAARSQCSNNLRQICIAMHNVNDSQGKLPPMIGEFPAKDQGYGTFFFFLLPYIEQDNLYKNAAETVGGKQQYNIWVKGTPGHRIPTYECPDDKSNAKGDLFQDWLAPSSYAANALAFGVTDAEGNVTSLQGMARIPASFPDGTSNTICFAERYQLCNGDVNAWGYYADSQWAPMFARFSKGKFQTQPIQADCDANVPQSPHQGGIMVGMGDGSSHYVASKISSVTWWAACTPNGGEVLGADWSN
jgi:hypothetical protein